MAKVFISYRRKDSQMADGRLAQSPRAHFGEAQIFRDKESIQPASEQMAGLYLAREIRTDLRADLAGGPGISLKLTNQDGQ